MYRRHAWSPIAAERPNFTVIVKCLEQVIKILKSFLNK